MPTIFMYSMRRILGVCSAVHDLSPNITKFGLNLACDDSFEYIYCAYNVDVCDERQTY